MFVFTFCFWNVVERSRAGFSCCKQRAHKWQGRGSLGAGALEGTERAHEDKTPTGSCRGRKIGRQKGARAESLSMTFIIRARSCSLVSFKNASLPFIETLVLQVKLFLLLWQADCSGACPRRKLSHLASPAFPALSDSWGLVPTGFFEDLSWNSSLTNCLAARRCQWLTELPQGLGRGPWLQFWKYRSWPVPSACLAPAVALSTAACARGHTHGAVVGFQQEDCQRELLIALGDWGEHLDTEGCPGKDDCS